MTGYPVLSHPSLLTPFSATGVTLSTEGTSMNKIDRWIAKNKKEDKEGRGRGGTKQQVLLLQITVTIIKTR